MLGQRANGDQVDSRFGNRDQCVVGHVAGCFQFGFAVGMRDGSAKRLKIKVIQHDAVGSGLQRQIEFRRVFHLYFDRFVGSQCSGGRDRLADPARGRYVVLFNQKGVEQPNTVIVAAPAGNCVLLREPKSRHCLSGVE